MTTSEHQRGERLLSSSWGGTNGKYTRKEAHEVSPQQWQAGENRGLLAEETYAYL